MRLMMRAPDPLGRLRIPLHRLLIPSLCRRAWQMVLGAAAGRVALLDVLDAGCSEGIREYVLGDAVSSTCGHDVSGMCGSDEFTRRIFERTDENDSRDELAGVAADDCCHGFCLVRCGWNLGGRCDLVIRELFGVFRCDLLESC